MQYDKIFKLTGDAKFGQFVVLPIPVPIPVPVLFQCPYPCPYPYPCPDLPICGSPGESEIKASIAALKFIFSNASRFDVSPSTLAKELQQLGLPKGQNIRTPTVTVNIF